MSSDTLAEFRDADALPALSTVAIECLQLLKAKDASVDDVAALIERDPENIELITRAINSLVRLYVAKHNLGKENTRKMKDAVRNVLNSVAIPLGIEFLTRIGK